MEIVTAIVEINPSTNMSNLNSLPNDIISNIVQYNSTTELWSLSRTCWAFYGCLDKTMYKFFKERFTKEIEERERMYGFKVDYFLGILNPRKHVYTGSLVWSTLLGEEWDDQDIDVFAQRQDSNDPFTPVIFPQIGNVSCLHYNQGQELFPVDHGVAFDDDFVYNETYSVFWTPPYANRRLKIMDLVTFTGTVEDKLKCFDIVACMCSFDNKWLTIPNPRHTLFKRTDFSDFFQQNQTRLPDYQTCKRAEKYLLRGVTFVNIA